MRLLNNYLSNLIAIIRYEYCYIKIQDLAKLDTYYFIFFFNTSLTIFPFVNVVSYIRVGI